MQPIVRVRSRHRSGRAARSGGARSGGLVGWRHARPRLPLRARSPTSPVPRGLPLVAGLTGFADAGCAVAQLDDYLLDDARHRRSSRRSTPTRCSTTARGVRSSTSSRTTSPTTVRRGSSSRLAHDELGQPFLLLTGLRARLPVGAVHGRRCCELVEALRGVVDTTWVHAIPMPVPHTRPIGMTVSGNRADLIEAHVDLAPAHAGAVERAAPARVPPRRSRGIRRPGSCCSSRTTWPTPSTRRPRSPRSRAISAATGPDLPDRRAARGEPRVPGRRSTSRSPRTTSSRRSSARSRSATTRYMEGTTLRSPLTDEDGELPAPTSSRRSSSSSSPTGARATTTSAGG